MSVIPLPFHNSRLAQIMITETNIISLAERVESDALLSRVERLAIAAILRDYSGRIEAGKRRGRKPSENPTKAALTQAAYRARKKAEQSLTPLDTARE